MAYKKYIKRGGKLCGPYYYESYRDSSGKVKKRYVGTVDPDAKTGFLGKLFSFKIILGLVLILLVLGVGITTYNSIDSTEVSFLHASKNLFYSLVGFSVAEPEEIAVEPEIEEVVGDGNSRVEDNSGSVVDENSEDAVGGGVVDEPEVILETNESEEVENGTVEELNEMVEGLNETVEDLNGTEINETISEEILNESEEVENETVEDLNGTGINETLNGTEIVGGLGSVGENLTSDETVGESEVFENETIQYRAVIGRPVKWVKYVNLSQLNESVEPTDNKTKKIKLPKNALNITLKTGNEAKKAIEEVDDYSDLIDSVEPEELKSLAITGNVVFDLDEHKGIFSLIWDWITSFTLTGQVILEDDLTQNITETEDGKLVDVSGFDDEVLAIEYVTEAPKAFESFDGENKQVVISGPEDVHYTEILAYTEIDNSVKMSDIGRLKLYHVEDSAFSDFEAYDLDGDSMVDYIEWVVPHLSNQTYQIIIEISAAEHLDENRSYVSDVYELVNAQDDVWFDNISSGEYLRVTFEKNLTSVNDITLYARGNGSVEVYEKDGNESLISFEIEGEGLYKEYLTSLVGEEDSFDLLVIGDVDFDWVVDPSVEGLTNGNFSSDANNWNVTLSSADNSGAWENTGRTGGSVYGDTYGIDKLGTAIWNQTFSVDSATISGIDYANLSFCYNVSHYNVVDAFNLSVTLTDPSSNEYTVWSSSPTGTVSWTCVDLNVTSNFTESGNYNLKLIHDGDLGNDAAAQVRNYWDDVSLNFTYADSAAPEISFVSLTPDDLEEVGPPLIINVSITESDLDEVKFNWNGTNYTVFDNSTFLYMNFDNRSSLGENDTHVFDISGNGNNGTVIGEGDELESAGRYNGALHCDGNDMVNISDSLSNRAPKDLSIFVWVNADSFASTFNYILEKGLNDNYDAYSFFYSAYSSHGLSFEFKDASGSFRTYSSSIMNLNVGEWYYVGFVFDDTNDEYAFYTNGEKIANGSNSYSLNSTFSNDLWLCRQNNGGYNYYWDGYLDDLMILNRSVNDAEANQFYMTSLTRYDNDSFGLYVNQSKNSTDSLDSGNYTYFVSASNLGAENLTETRTVVFNPDFDSVAPDVSLNSPADNILLDDLEVTFNCSLTDNYGLENVTLYGNWSGGWQANETVNLTGTSNSTTFILNLSDESSYRWNCYACDNSSNCGFADSNKSFEINTSAFGCIGIQPPSSGNWTINGDTSCSNMDILMNGNINVEAGYSLTFDSVNLTMNVSGEGGLEIENYGGMNISNSFFNATIDDHNHDNNYLWHNYLGSELNLINSNFTYFGKYTGSAFNRDRGVYIQSDNSYIDNCSFFNFSYSYQATYRSALSLNGSNNFTMKNSYIGSSGRYDHPVYVINSDNLNFEDNELISTYSSYELMKFEDSSNISILNSNFSASTNGPLNGVLLFIDSVNATVKGNEITSSNGPLEIRGTSSSHFNHTIDTTNTNDGLPLLYVYNNDSGVWNDYDFSSYGGVVFGDSDNLSLNNCTFGIDGLSLSGSDNVTVNGSSFNYTDTGLYLSYSDNFNVINNYFEYISGTGIGDRDSVWVTYYSNYGVFDNNTVYSTGDANQKSLVYIYYSDYSNLTNNNLTMDLRSYEGVYTSYSDNLFIVNNSIVNTRGDLYSDDYFAVYIYQDTNLTFNGNFINYSDTSTDDSFGLRLHNVDDAEIKDNYIYAYGSYDLYVVANSYDPVWDSDVYLINTTLGNSSDFLHGNYTGDLYYQWYFNVNITNETGAGIGGVNVSVYNYTGSVVFSELTDSDGMLSSATNLTDWFSDSALDSDVVYGPYNVTVTKFAYYGNETPFNLSENTVINLTMEVNYDDVYPSFSGYSDNSGNFNGTAGAEFNVTVDSTNGTVYLSINGSNYSATNLSSNMYNVSLTIGEGNYSYYWFSYGNGSLGNYNSSEVRYYFVGSVAPNISFEVPTLADGVTTGHDYLYVNVSSSDLQNISTFIDFDNSLVSWWRMDDLNGSGDVVDYMGRNNGSVVENASQVDNGKMGKGMSFDGDGDYVDCGNMNLTSNFTISLWFKRAGLDTSSHRGIISKDRSYVMRFGQTTGDFEIYFGNGTTWDGNYNSAGNLEDDVWYHVVSTYNGTRSNLYLNGVLNDSIIPDRLVGGNSNNFNIGSWRTVSESFNGTIDDVMIFNRSLSVEEIAALYANTSSRHLEVNYTGLSDLTNYTFKAYSQDSFGNVNSTGEREVGINVSSGDILAPFVDFVAPTPDDGNITYNNYFGVNVSSTEVSRGDGNVSVFVNFNNSLVSWWRMDDLNGSGDVVDYMGRNNGSVVGDAVQNESGVIGKSFSFDGAGDWIDTLSIDASSLVGFSYSFWVKTTPASDGGIPISWGTGNVRFCRVGGVTSNKINCAVDASSSGSAVSTSDITDSEWHHIVFTSTVNSQLLYFDGVQEGSSTESLSTTSGIFRIGAHASTPTTYDFNGSIDDVMIFNRSLSSAEISGLYANTSSRYLEVNYTGLSYGNYTLVAYAQDSLGNVNYTNERTVEFSREDLVFPSVDFLSPTPDDLDTINNSYFYLNVSGNDSGRGDGNVSVVLDFNDSLVIWYKFDEMNSTHVLNYVNQSRDNGLIVGDASQVSGCKRGLCFSFDGAGDRISVANSAALQSVMGVGQPRSWGYWVIKRSSMTNDLITDVPAFNGKHYWSEFNGNRIRGGVQLNPYVQSGVLDDNVWYHAFITYNGTHSWLYINGSLVSGPVAQTAYAVSTTDTLSLMAHSAGTYSVNGSLDDFMLFNRYLGPEEVQAIYANTSFKYLGVNISGLSDLTNYTFKAYSEDGSGNVNSTEERTVSINLSSGSGNLFILSSSLDSDYNFTGDVDGLLVNGSSYSNSQWINVSNSSSGELSLRVYADFEGGDVDLSLVSFFGDSKRIGVNLSSASGLGINHTLYLKKYNDAGIYVCPDALSLSEINVSCSGRVDFSFSDMGSWKSGIYVNVENSYYKIENLTGSGGGTDNVSAEISFVSPTPDDGSGQSSDSIFVNLSVNDTLSNVSTFIDFDNSLVSWWRMDDLGTSYCYQESANVSTSCGGLSTGTYSWQGTFTDSNNMVDGNTTTIGSATSYPSYFYVNYTKPTSARESSLIMVTVYEETSMPTYQTYNFSIPIACFEQSVLQFRDMFSFTSLPSDSFSCYNGSSWETIGSGFRSNGLYEEAMWWSIENTSVVTDYMSRNNGSVVGDAVQTDDGVMGKAFSFDGGGDYVDVSDSVELEPSNITIAMWVYPTTWTHSTHVALISKRNVVSDGFMLFQLSDGNLNMDFGGSAERWNTGYLPSLNTWTQVVYTYNGTNGVFYADGGYISNTSKGDGSNTGSTADLRIGMDSSSVQYPFNGTIDDVMIFNRSLSSEEIAALYANTSSRYLGVNYTGLSEGNHTFKAYVQDVAGNVNSTEERTVSYNATGDAIYIDNCTELNQSGKTYYVNQSIVDARFEVCMNITADNVTLDCQGNVIDGQYSSAYLYGVRIYGENSVIKNCHISDWKLASVYSYGYSNVSVLDSITNMSDRGIYLRYAYNSTLDNLTSYNHSLQGVYLYDAEGTRVSNFTGYHNGEGIHSRYNGLPIYITDSILYNNSIDFGVNAISSAHCQDVLTNVTDNNGKPVVYFNSTVNIENWNNNFSEMIFCNADNSIIRNVSLMSENHRNHIAFFETDNVSVSDVYVNDSYNGVYVRSARNNNFDNITVENSYYGGILMYQSSGNNITNFTARNNNYGFEVQQVYTNIIRDSVFEGSSVAGMYFDNLDDQLDNFIYNNLFNNSVNFEFTNDGYNVSVFNISLQNGTRIYSSGTQIGGNYYTNSTGNGFSDSCDDADHDGFCDSALNISTMTTCTQGVDCGDDVDYLVLSSNYSSGELGYTEVSGCSELNESNTQYRLMNNVNSSGTCFNITAENVTLNGMGYNVIYGNTSSVTTDFGIYSNQNYTNIKNFSVRMGSAAASWNSRYGIYFRNSYYGKIENVNASNNNYGIYLVNGDKNNITDSIVNNAINGFYIHAINSYLDNLTATENTGNGIYFYDAYYSIVYNSNFSENTQYDINVITYSNTGCNLDFQNITVSRGENISYYNSSINLSNSEHSLLVLCNADNSNLTNITIKGSDSLDNNGLLMLRTNGARFNYINSSNNFYGIHLYTNDDNNVFENITVNDNVIGIYSEISTDYNNFTNIEANLNGQIGFYLNRGANNRVYNLTMNNCSSSSSYACLYVKGEYGGYSDSNLFENVYINSTTNSGRGIWVRSYTSGNARNNLFKDIKLENIDGEEVRVERSDGQATNNTFLNVTYNISKENVTGTNVELIRKWYFETIVNDSNGFLESANVSGYNVSSSTVFSLLTNSTGEITKQELIEYVNNGTRIYATPHIINTSKSGYVTNSTTYNLTSEENIYHEVLLSVLNLGYTEVSGCSELNESNTQYRLINNVSSNATCFNITASNVTLDGNGYTINYSKVSTGYGVYVEGVNNATIKGLNIISDRSAATYIYGVFLNKSNSSIIENNTFYSPVSSTYSSNHLIYLLNSNNNRVDNNTLYQDSAQSYGIQLTGSEYNNITNNFQRSGDRDHSNYQRGFSFSDSDYNRIESNNITTSIDLMGYPLYLASGSDYNDVLNNNLTAGGSSTDAVRIVSSTQNNFSGNNLEAYSFLGIYFEGSNSSDFNHTIDSSNTFDGLPINYTKEVSNVQLDFNEEYGQVIIANSNNITIDGSNFTVGGLQLYNTPNSKLMNSNLTNVEYAGAWFMYSDNSTAYNNFVSTTKYYATAIQLVESNNCNISKNNLTAIGYRAYHLTLRNSSNCFVEDNSMGESYSNHWRYGLDIVAGSNNNTFRNNSINIDCQDRVGCYGVYLSASSNNYFEDLSVKINMTLNAYHAVYLNNNAWDNVFNYTNILTDNNDGIYSDSNKNNNSIYNSIIDSTNHKDISVGTDQDAGSFLKLYNTTFNESDVLILDTDFTLYNYNYLDVNVTDSATSLAVEGANVTSLGEFSELTAASGFITTQSLLEFNWTNSSGKVLADNYIVNTTKAGYVDDSQSVNMSENVWLDVSLNPMGYTPVYDCGDLDQSGTYYLMNDVNSSGTCFNITASNGTLDCQGHSINYSTGGVLGYGVVSSSSPGSEYSNITVRNCSIYEGNATTSYKYGIYFYYADNSSVLDNHVETIGVSSYPYSLISSDNLIVERNFGSSIPGNTRGMYLSSSSNATIVDNILTTSGGSSYALQLYNSNNCNLTGNEMNASGGRSLMVNINNEATLGLNHTIDTTNLVFGKPVLYYYDNDSMVLEDTNFSDYGIVYIARSENVTVNNCSFANEGIHFLDVDNSTLNNSNAIGNHDYNRLIEFVSGSDYNNITNNFVNVTTGGFASYGIFLGSEGEFNNVNYNTIQSDSGWGHALYVVGDNNTFVGNNISTKATAAMGIYLSTGASYNYFLENDILVEGNAAGIRSIDDCLGNIFNYTDVTTTVSGSVDGGIFFDTDVNTLEFHNGVINASLAEDVHIDDGVDPGSWLKLYNTTWNESDVEFNDEDFTLYNYNYLDVNVTDSATSLAVEGANVTSLGEFSELTSSNGFISTQSLLEFNWTNSSGKILADNYTVNTTKVGYSDDSSSVNMSDNQQLDIILSSSISTNVWNCSSVNRFDNSSCWSLGRVPIAGDEVVFNGSGTGDCNITNNTLPQNLKNFTVEGSYGNGVINFLPLFAVGNWTGRDDGTQIWNVTENIVINNGTMKIWGDYRLVDTYGIEGNITDDGHGQEWNSLNGNISVGGSGVLDGDGLGFLNGTGPGSGSGGGTYGGRGFYSTKNPYGNASAPVSLGSGENYGTSVYYGGSAIKITGTNLLINGRISMNGDGGGTNAKCGSGGSIWFVADNISGSGNITADGGMVTSSAQSWPGGGGRIRLEYGNNMDLTGKISVSRGTSYGTNKGLDGTLTFTNNTWPGNWNLTGNIGLLGGDYGEGNITIVQGNFNTLGYNMTIYGDCFYDSNDPINCYNKTSDGRGVYINATGDINISQNSIISGTGLGFPAGYGPGTYFSGSYGGTSAKGGLIYGDEKIPLSLGSGGDEGSGGSAISFVTNLGNIFVDGDIEMIGYGSLSLDAGGAGGSIFLHAKNIFGSGNLRSYAYDTDNVPGSGGRIALSSLGTIYFSGSIETYGGEGPSSAFDGSGGTVYINASNITSSMNVDTSGYDGGNITLSDTYLFLTGNYNATGSNSDATIKLDYTDCSSDTDYATFDPDATYLTSCTVTRVNNWICNGATQNFTNSSCWSKGRVPIAGDEVVFNGSGTGDCNITNNTLPQNLKNFTVEGSYGNGVINFLPLFAVGNWTGRDDGTQIWNVTENIVINNGTMKIWGDYRLVDFFGIEGNITNDGHGQEWNSLSGNISVGGSGVLDGVGLGFSATLGPGGDNYFGGAYGGRTNGNTLTYGSAISPTSLGSGGASGAGGSAIKFSSDNVTLDGFVNMRAYSDVGGARGSGGSIWVNSVNFYGSGILYAMGEDIGSNLNREGGGGGRIAITVISNVSYSGEINVDGGEEYYTWAGVVNAHGYGGTVFINSSNFISMDGNISSVGDYGGQINLTTSLLYLYGYYNASYYLVGGNGDGNIKLDYTDCSSDYSSAVFDPSATDLSSCDIYAPGVVVNSPLSQAYFEENMTFDLTVSDAGAVSTCWYTLDDGVSNVTLNNDSSSHFYGTNGSLVDSSYTSNFFCNDTSGNLNNSESVNFEIDAVDDVAPLIEFGNGTSESGNQSNHEIFINVSANDTYQGGTNVSTFIDFDNSLVSWWRMDDLNVSGDVVDYMGRNNGTLGGDVRTNVSGVFGNASYFDGNGDYITLGEGISVGTRSFTTSAWFKTSDSGPMEFMHMRSGSDTGLVFYLHVTAAAITVWNGTTTCFSSTTGYNDGHWHFASFVRNSSDDFMIYVDGNVSNVCTDFLAGQTINNMSDFGGWQWSGWDWNGSIDDVMFWNRSLSVEEIDALYANTSSKYLAINYTELSGGNYSFKAYVQDTSGNVNTTEEREVNISNDAQSFAISLSSKLAQAINWTFDYLPIYNQSTEGNNGEGVSEFFINVSTDGGLIDLYIMGSDLMTDALDVLGVGNETISFSSTNSSVPSDVKSSLTTSYADNKIGDGLGNGDVVYLKFFLNAMSGQAAGSYNNTLDIRAVGQGEAP